MSLLSKLLSLGGQPMLMEPGACQDFFTAIEHMQAGKIEKRADLLDALFGATAVDTDPDGDGIAMIKVLGTLTNRRWWSYNYQEIGAQLRQALEDSSISHVVLDIDSPGGEVNGVFDLAESIFDARGDKPITALVADKADSAAYLIASACDEVVVSKTGEVGSVGVVATHVDRSGMFKKYGVVHTHVFAGDHKTDLSASKPLSKKAKARLQEEVNSLYKMFTEAVAKYRGMSVDDVVATQAQTYTGQEAIDMGLADRIEAYDAAIQRVADAAKATQPNEVKSMSKKTKLGKNEEVTVDASEDENVVTNATAEETTEETTTEDPKSMGNNAAALIIEACNEAGLAYMAVDFVRTGATMEQVKTRLEEADNIKTACKLAGLSDNADTYLKQGMSLEQVQGKLLTHMANADEETEVDSSVSPKAASRSAGTQDESKKGDWDGAFAKAGATIRK